MDELIDQQVAIDTDSSFAYIGVLKEAGQHFLRLADVAVYDRENAQVQLEKYLIECAEFGVPVSRGKVLVRVAEIVAITPLSSIVLP